MITRVVTGVKPSRTPKYLFQPKSQTPNYRASPPIFLTAECPPGPGHKNFFFKEIKMITRVVTGVEPSILCVLGTRNNRYATKPADAKRVNFLNKFISSLWHSCSWHVAPVMWHLCLVAGRHFQCIHKQNFGWGKN